MSVFYHIQRSKSGRTKTRATLFPDAAAAAAFRSVSLKDEETTVPSALERFVIASTGYKGVSIRMRRYIGTLAYCDEVRVVVRSTSE